MSAFTFGSRVKVVDIISFPEWERMLVLRQLESLGTRFCTDPKVSLGTRLLAHFNPTLTKVGDRDIWPTRDTMEFFSGLRKAYDSLGTEISRTFDSSEMDETGEEAERSRESGSELEKTGQEQEEVSSEQLWTAPLSIA